MVEVTPEVTAARSEVAARVPAAQVHGFRRPVLVLNPRSGSVQAVRGQLLDTAARYGVAVREAAAPGRGLAGGDGPAPRRGAGAGPRAREPLGWPRRRGEGWAHWTATSFEVDSPDGRLEVGIDGEAVVLGTPIEFRIHAGALRVLVPPPRPVAGRPPGAASPARRRAPGIAPTREGRIEQVAALVRLGRLLGRVGEREFGPGFDGQGRPVRPRRRRRSGERGPRPDGEP